MLIPLLFLLLSNSLLLCQTQPLSQENICLAVDSQTDFSTYLPVDIDSEEDISQSECVKNFQVTIDSVDYLDQFLYVEIIFDDFPPNPNFRPLLLAKSGRFPEVVRDASDNVIIKADKYDENDFLNRKPYHQIVIQPQDLSLNEIIYFSLYYYMQNVADYVPITTNYKVRVTSTATFPCPRDCSGKGLCDLKLQKCLCDRGNFDLDCSVPAIEIPSTPSSDTRITPKNNALFWTDRTGPVESLKLIFNKTGGLLFLNFLYVQPTNFTVPNSKNALATKVLLPTQNQSYLIFPEIFLYLHPQSVLLVNAVNPGEENVSISMVIEIYDGGMRNRSTLMIVMIGVSTLLIVFWGLITIVKYRKYSRYRPIPQDNMNIQNEDREVLSIEDLNQYFPVKNHTDHQYSFPQTQCAICLEDFKPDSPCRQLYCEHTFHATCVEKWLREHDCCPNCRKSMAIEAIQEFLANPKANEPESPQENGTNSREAFTRSQDPPFEEEKEQRSLNDLSIQIERERSLKKKSSMVLPDAGNIISSRDKRSNSHNGPNPRSLNLRKISSNKDGSSLQSEVIDIEEHEGKDKDLRGQIWTRVTEKNSNIVGEKNPLPRFQHSSPEKKNQ